MEKNSIQPILPEAISIEEIRMINRNIFCDSRGYLIETYDKSKESKPSVYSYSSLVQPGCAKDVDKYHHHKLQGDRFTVVLGKIWVLLLDLRENSSSKGKLEVVVLKGGDPENKEKMTIPCWTLTIPPGVYHGIMNPLSFPSILVNHPTFEYNPDDEARTLFTEVPVPSLNNNYFSWDIVKNE